MLGPVLSLEILLGMRRNRLHALRRILAGWLVFQAIVFFAIHCTRKHSLQALAINDFVDTYYQFFVVEHFLFLMLTAPAFVAGAITDEKAQGTLQHLLIADVTSWEVIIGKLLGRTAQVAVVSLAGWPLLCLVAGYGHRPILPIVCLALLTVIFLVLLGSASLWASVRCKQTNQAVMRVYLWFGVMALGMGLLATSSYWIELLWWYTENEQRALAQRLAEVGNFLYCFNPVYVLEPTWSDNNLAEFARRLWIMLQVYGSVSVTLLALSVWQLRPSMRRYLEGARRERRRFSWRPAMDDEPVLWREREVGRGILRWIGVALIASATYISTRWIIELEQPVYFLVPGAVVGLVLSFIVGVRASGAISGERERQTWESLLLTPMDTWEIIEDKVNGVLQSVDPFFIAFLVPALVLSFQDRTSRLGGLLLTIAIIVIDWAAMVYMAAAGVHASAHAQSSWRGLVATVAGGYAYCFGLMALLAFAYVWLGCILGPLVWVFLAILGYTNVTYAVTLSVCMSAAVGLTWLFWRRAVIKTGNAEFWIDSHERYGKNFVRSLTMALRKHYQRLQERRRQKGQPVDQSMSLFGPPA